MPVENIEVVLIFFILFFISSSLIYLFVQFNDDFNGRMTHNLVEISKNNFFICYTIVSYFNGSILCSPSYAYNAKVYKSANYISVSLLNEFDLINITNVFGVGLGKFYLYNDEGTIYIIS